MGRTRPHALALASRGQKPHGTAGVGLVVTRSREVLTLEPGRTI